MKMTTWSPFVAMPEFRDEWNRFFGSTDLFAPEREGAGAFVPAIDVVQRPDALVFHAELPGIKKDDVTIEIEDGRLTLSGERKQREEFRQDDVYRIERSYGRFQRSFTLPTNVDPAGAKARFEDGVLELTLPKLEATKPRRVEIEA